MAQTLLLADDSITIQRVIELTFADEDIRVLVVGDGRQAIERLQAEPVDIVLADIGMPERSGYEVAAFVKGNPGLSHIPVVLLSGAFEPLDEYRAREVGCDGVLMKPFEPQMVITRVRELLASARRPDLPATARSASGPAPAQPDTSAEAGARAVPGSPDTYMAAGDDEPEPMSGDALEDYFDRLDAAFANIGSPARVRALSDEEDLTAALAELDEPPPARGGREPEAVSSWDPDVPGGLAPARTPAPMAAAFAALLAAEEGSGSPDSALAFLAAPPPAPLPAGSIGIDDIVERVIARMADDSMRRLVLETAERLVRDEIARIKRTGIDESSAPRTF